MISQEFRQFPVVTNQAQSIAKSLFKRQYFALALLLLLFIPIAVLAAWGLHHSRPSYANYQFFSKDGKEYAVCNFFDVGKATMATLCIDAQPDTISRKSYSIKSIRFPESPMPSNKKSQTEKYLRVGEENGRTWVVKQFDSTTLVLFQIEFTSVLATTSVIELGEQVSGIRGVFICNGKLVLLINNRLEMRDAISGQVLDSLATQTSTKTDLIPMQGTRNVFTFDAVANKATMYEVGDDTFRPIQEWNALDAQVFEKGDQMFITSLLPDGATIEVRSAKEGSVVSVVSIPSDIGLVLPIGGFVGFVHHGFIEWRSINCCIDLFTGKNHQLPNSFVVTERDFDGGRFIATRQDNKKRKTDCIVVDEATDAEVFRFSVDALGGTIRILRKSGQIVFATYDHRFFVYDLKRGNLVHVIDPFRWGFPLNFGATAAFLLWCIVWLRIVSSIHPFGWIDTVVCIGTFIAYATYQFYFSIGFQNEVLVFSNVGVLMSSIVLTNIWLCMGRKRLFRRTAPIVLVFGLAVGLIVCWIEQPETQSYLIAGVTVLTLGMMLPLIAMRWAGVRFQNTKLDSTTEICQSNERESYVNLRDIFLFTFVSAIVTSIFRRIPLSHWYGFWFERGFGTFLFLVGIHFAGLVVISVLAIWTSFSRRGFVSRWGPWLVVAVGWLSINEIFQQWPLFYVLGSFAIASSATLFIGCLSYRMRGWRFVEDGTLPIFK